MTVTRVDTVVTKSDRVRQLIRCGKEIEALRIAKSFRWLGEHKITIQRGWDAHTNPRFARSLGRDPDHLLGAALAALSDLYG